MTLFPAPEIPTTSVVLATKYPPFTSSSSPGMPVVDPGGRVERGAPFALQAAGRLDATIDLEPLTVDDPERVTSQGILVAARLHDLD